MGNQLRIKRGNALPLSMLRQATRWLTRSEQEDLIEQLIAALDAADGSDDVELNGDEYDSTLAEDDWCVHRPDGAAGCPVSDPPEDDDNDRCLAGDDGVFAGPAVIADALGFSSRPNRYAVSIDEDCEA